MTEMKSNPIRVILNPVKPGILTYFSIPELCGILGDDITQPGSIYKGGIE